ncbi:hypothetical protein [Streptomyces sp. NBC_01800]|uniref:hypothetical protein n=1 Tax=Streptomyces sp. NBC_01800 TaxID=2975945 RepID=UPI002DDC7448|nr:hypothetical protein [Streptomyces sp. NBC_01800]WSA72100.1 hypothetical protein OIE65_37000 [Streptomyces sp. NBC_01800]
MDNLVFGLDTFGDLPEDHSGVPVSHARAIRQVVDEAVLADDIGVDVIVLGEHHRPVRGRPSALRCTASDAAR